MGNLAAAAEADKIISELAIKSKFKDDEADAIANLGGTDLADRLDELKAKREQALKENKRKMENKAADDELKLREAKENDFYKEREALILADNQKKRAMIEEFMDANEEEGAVQQIGKKLLSRLGKSAQEELMDLEKERDSNIETAQCKSLAGADGNVRELQ